MECRFCGATFATLPESGNCPKCNFRIESAPVVEGKVCACGIQNKANAKFCRSCGTPLGLAPAAPAAPRILPGLKFVASPAPRVERDAQAPAAPDRIMPELKFAAAPADPVVRAPEPLAATPRKPYAWYFAGGALAVVLAGVGIAVRVQGGGAASPSVATAAPAAAAAQAPAPAVPVKPAAVTIQADPAWFLKGGEISGGFVPVDAQAEWPEWMQALVGTRTVSAAELEKSEFYCVPDRFLVHAAGVLDDQKVYTPALLGQMLGIGYTADAAAWRTAKARYQKNYLAAKGLPTDDPLTCSRLLTQLTYAKEYAAVRAAIQSSGFPADHETRSSWLRMVDQEEGHDKPTPDRVLETSHPPAERFSALMGLPKSAPGHDLVESFRGTAFFPNAVFQGVLQGWCNPSDPMVAEAIKVEHEAAVEPVWFLFQNSERASDLLWVSCVDALAGGRKEEAAQLANALLERFPNSWYSGHAIFLLSCLGQGTGGHAPRLTMPGDVTVYNTGSLSLSSARRPWAPPYDALANQGRFDLIMARVSPRAQPDIYLMAAAAAGQADLAGRFMAVEKKGVPEFLPFTFPVELAPLVDGIILEEGLKGEVDAAFVLSVIKGESLFQPWASSSADASGLMQLLKPTFQRMMGKKADINDPLTNIHAGLKYFKQVIKTAGLQGLPSEVKYTYILAGYHAGEGRAKSWRTIIESKLLNGTGPEQTLLRVESIPIVSTRQYLTRVLGDYEIYSKLISK